MTTKAKKPTDEKSEGTVKLFNANDGIHGRDGGPYLDRVEAAHWEKIYAAREGREPDLETATYPGILLRTENQQVAEYNPTLIAGDDRRHSTEIQAKVYAEVEPVKSVLGDFSLTDTEDKGDVDEFEAIDPPLFDKPDENEVSTAVASSDH